ncbi:MAG: LamG domain-containing protein, partial [Flavobacterium sp.]
MKTKVLFKKNNNWMLLFLLLFGVATTQAQTSATALDFDGSNDIVIIPNTIPASAEKTYEAWVYPTRLSGHTVVLNHTNWTTGAIHFQFWDNKIHLDINYTADYECTYSFDTNVWYHIATVYSTASKTMKFYVNGALIDTFAVDSDRVATIPANAQIELGGWHNDRYFKGKIDEVRIWNRALSQGEIQSDMNCELTVNQAGLVAYYKFNQGNDSANNTSETSLTDASGNGNNGTLYNFDLNGTTSNWAASSPIVTGTTCAPLTYTLIPNSSFEQVLIDQNLDDMLDGKVLTANINKVTTLSVGYTTVEDITGIED